MNHRSRFEDEFENAVRSAHQTRARINAALLVLALIGLGYAVGGFLWP